MREFTKGKEGGTGAVPGASRELTPHSNTEKADSTEQCSVATANVCHSPGARQQALEGPPEASAPTVRWCAYCLEDGDKTALPVDAPADEELCEAHRRNPARYLTPRCTRTGCRDRVLLGDTLCGFHRRIAATVRAVAEVRSSSTLAEAWERSWQALAERADLDPVTVATCKALRDKEVHS